MYTSSATFINAAEQVIVNLSSVGCTRRIHTGVRLAGNDGPYIEDEMFMNNPKLLERCRREADWLVLHCRMDDMEVGVYGTPVFWAMYLFDKALDDRDARDWLFGQPQDFPVIARRFFHGILSGDSMSPYDRINPTRAAGGEARTFPETRLLDGIVLDIVHRPPVRKFPGGKLHVGLHYDGGIRFEEILYPGVFKNLSYPDVERLVEEIDFPRVVIEGMEDPVVTDDPLFLAERMTEEWGESDDGVSPIEFVTGAFRRVLDKGASQPVIVEGVLFNAPDGEFIKIETVDGDLVYDEKTKKFMESIDKELEK